jgi:predicted GNAT family acetyltransferase
VAETSDGVVAAGNYQPMNQIAEIVAVSTLPAMRRPGLAGAVTARLVQHARDSGVQLLVLSAQNDQVARVYQRIGFHRIGTACAAEQPA